MERSLRSGSLVSLYARARCARQVTHQEEHDQLTSAWKTVKERDDELIAQADRSSSV